MSDDGVLAWPFRQWCRLNGISVATGYLARIRRMTR